MQGFWRRNEIGYGTRYSAQPRSNSCFSFQLCKRAIFINYRRRYRNLPLEPTWIIKILRWPASYAKCNTFHPENCDYSMMILKIWKRLSSDILISFFLRQVPHWTWFVSSEKLSQNDYFWKKLVCGTCLRYLYSLTQKVSVTYSINRRPSSEDPIPTNASTDHFNIWFPDHDQANTYKVCTILS